MIPDITEIMIALTIETFASEFEEGRYTAAKTLPFIEDDANWQRRTEDVVQSHGMADDDSIAGILFDKLAPFIDWERVRQALLTYLRAQS